MHKFITLGLTGLVILLIVNGVRLTFFPNQACDLARDNIIPSIEQSVMKFHVYQAKKGN
jgi:hypothetical protein